ncbi:DUF4279 domain-containing protein [Tundrisphaera sp. TA3]|uniref:DUF4279 domain-containing protein n=1 Tax=Tundrisphaera sp. TA3 TaxID=3435775 RepID=UPI003EC06B86
MGDAPLQDSNPKAGEVQEDQSMSTSMSSDRVISISLKLTSLSLSPEEIIDIYPIAYTKKWTKGDAIGRSSLHRKHNGVSLELPCEAGWELEPVILKLLDMLDPAKILSGNLMSNGMIECELSCTIVFSSSPPSCYLNPSTLRRIADLGFSLDIDLIYAPVEEQDHLVP